MFTYFRCSIKDRRRRSTSDDLSIWADHDANPLPIKVAARRRQVDAPSALRFIDGTAA